MGKGNIHIFKERRLLRFCLWLFKTSQLLNSQSKKKATVDVYGVCYISLVHLCCINIRCTLSLYISAWAISVLLDLASWAMRRPGVAGRVTGTDSRAFSFYMSNLNLLL